MRLARPSVAEERWLTLAARHGAAVGERSSGWKSSKLASRCLFFVLALVGAGALWSVMTLLDVPLPAVVGGLVLIGAAEWLIARRRLFASGFEEALWIAGALGIAIELLAELAPSGDAGLPLVVSAALLLAAWRLLNAAVATLAVVVLSIAVMTLLERAGVRHTASATAAGLFCFAVAAAVLAAGARLLQRPAHDRTLDGLVVAMPLAGYVWASVATQGTHSAVALPLLLPLAFGAAALVVGLRRRTHAPLFAALACLVCCAIELRSLLALPRAWHLIVAGAMVLAIAWWLERALRVPRAGLTSRALAPDLAALELLQMAGTAAATPASQTQAMPRYEGSGGEFGGGGASGRF